MCVGSGGVWKKKKKISQSRRKANVEETCFAFENHCINIFGIEQPMLFYTAWRWKDNRSVSVSTRIEGADGGKTTDLLSWKKFGCRMNSVGIDQVSSTFRERKQKTHREQRRKKRERERKRNTRARICTKKKKSKSLNLKNTFYGDTSFFPFNFHHLFANNNSPLFFAFRKHRRRDQTSLI